MAKKLLGLLTAALMVLAVIPSSFAKTEPEQEPVRDAIASWDFEVNPTANGWTFLDNDGDGNNWLWTTETSSSSSHSIKSASYEGGALTPDNWAVSPYFAMPVGGATLSFKVKNHSSNFPENFSVYYLVYGQTDYHEVAVDQNVNGDSWVTVSYQLPGAGGQPVRIAIRHHNCTNLWKFYVDDVEISAAADPSVITAIEVNGFPFRLFDGQTAGGILANIAVPDGAHYTLTGVTAIDAATGSPLGSGAAFEEGRTYLFGASLEPESGYSFAEDAQVLINGGALDPDPDHTEITASASAVFPAALVCGGEAPFRGWYFETEDELDGWAALDEDGDETCWYLLDADSFGEPLAYEGRGFMGSPSWNNGALTPDDWLICPAFVVPGGETTLSFYASGLSEDYYAEHFAAYICLGDSESTGDYTELSPETTATQSYVQYTADISAYAGQTVRIAVRHFNCTDLNLLLLDQFEIFNTPGETPWVLGDIDGSGAVNVTDAVLALRCAMAIIELTDEQLARADVDGSGGCNAVDAIFILRYAMHIIDQFPAE